jgi:uncharacterized protein YgiB involved in biofilm formation
LPSNSKENHMKRSRSIELALMGGVPLLLAGCDHGHHDTALLYEDLQQCISDGQVPAVTCEEGYERALVAEERAPRYNSLAACEDEYGVSACRPAHEGSWFIPMAAGFMIARALDHQGAYYGYSGGWSGAASWYAQPVYHVRGDRSAWRTMSGERFTWGSRGPGAHTVSETLSRGGFGRAATARFSWGG